MTRKRKTQPFKAADEAGQVQLTPSWVTDHIKNFYANGITLDPATELSNPVGAKRFFTKEDNGLIQDWDSYPIIFINPPFNNITPFADKADLTYRRSLIYGGHRIFLLIPPRTEQAWYQNLAAHYPVLLLNKRVNYIKVGRKQSSCPFPSVMFLIGLQTIKEYQHFRKLGTIQTPLNYQLIG